MLWRNYIKWRCIKRILDAESILDDTHEAGSAVISQIIEEIISSHDLIVLLRHHSGLDELGDTVIEDDEHNLRYMTEVARLIFTHNRKKHDENIERNTSKTCCLEDLFGSIFGEMLNNIAFGKGNPNLVGKIVKATNANPDDIRGKLYDLAINRELLPKSMLKFLAPKTPLLELPNLIKTMPPAFSSEYLSDHYQPFILNIKAEGEKALERIIESHLWLVHDIVGKHFHIDMGVPFDDLIQEGSLGLLEAAKRFQPTLSSRFMSYAQWWIFQKVHRAIANQARTIRIPVHMGETINQLLETSLRLFEQYSREPTVAEIAEQMEISEDKVGEILKVVRPPISLDASIGEEGSCLSEVIDDRETSSPDDFASAQLLREQINNVLSTLTPRQQRVVQLRFGLEDGRSRTLEEIAREFNVTRERIRQIEDKALKRLRHPSRSRRLKDYFIT